MTAASHTIPSTDAPSAEIVSIATPSAVGRAPVFNPADTSQVVGYYAQADGAAVDAVVSSAVSAGASWGALAGLERARWLRRAAEAVSVGEEDRAVLLTKEQGKVLWESRVDVHSAARALIQNADLAERVDDEEIVRDSRGTTIIRRVPMGPTAVVVPWNYPIYLTLAGVAPALAAGNAVVVKPSEFAPLAITQTLRLIADSLPPGVLSVVPGDGPVTGNALISNAAIRKVIFTGGTATGRVVTRAAAQTHKSVSLELGGNDPAIILDSADLSDTTIKELRRAVFTCAGQICINVKRIYVHEMLHAEFLDKFTAAVDEIVVGAGLDPASTMGPLNNGQQFESITRLVQQTQRDADVQVLGRKADPSTWDRGHFVLPAIATGLTEHADLVVREQFGPIIPVMAFTDEQDVLRQANASEFGLAASIWSEDVDHALDMARRVEAGSVFVNTHRMGSSDQSMPFGGMKQSGLGRNHGRWAIDECSELQAISHRPDTSTFPGPRDV